MNASASRLVVNTSPLIHLAEAGLLRLLKEAATPPYTIQDDLSPQHFSRLV